MSLSTMLDKANASQLFNFSTEPDEKRTSLLKSRTHKIIEIMQRLSKDDKSSKDNHVSSLINLFISTYQSLNLLISNLCIDNKHLGISNLIDGLSNVSDLEDICSKDNLILYRMHRNMIYFNNNYKAVEDSFYLNAIEVMNNLINTISSNKLKYIKLLNKNNNEKGTLSNEKQG